MCLFFFVCLLVCECPAVTVAADKTGLHTHTHSRGIQIRCVMRHGGDIHYKTSHGQKPLELAAGSHTLRDKLP